MAIAPTVRASPGQDSRWHANDARNDRSGQNEARRGEASRQLARWATRRIALVFVQTAYIRISAPLTIDWARAFSLSSQSASGQPRRRFPGALKPLQPLWDSGAVGGEQPCGRAAPRRRPRSGRRCCARTAADGAETVSAASVRCPLFALPTSSPPRDPPSAPVLVMSLQTPLPTDPGVPPAQARTLCALRVQRSQASCGCSAAHLSLRLRTSHRAESSQPSALER